MAHEHVPLLRGAALSCFVVAVVVVVDEIWPLCRWAREMPVVESVAATWPEAWPWYMIQVFSWCFCLFSGRM